MICSGDNIKFVDRQRFAKEIIGMWLMNPLGRPSGRDGVMPAETLPAWTEGPDRMKWRESCQTLQVSGAIWLWTCVVWEMRRRWFGVGRAATTTMQSEVPQTGLRGDGTTTLEGKVPISLGWRTEHGAKEDYSSALRCNKMCIVGFWICLGPAPISYFSFFHFGMGISIVCLSQYCILLVGNLCRFTGSQLERNLASHISSPPYLI